MQADTLQTDPTVDQPMIEKEDDKKRPREDTYSTDVSVDDSSNGEVHKKKRRRIDRTPKDGQFLHFIGLKDEDRDDLIRQIEEQDYGVKVRPIQNSLIRVYPSEAEAKRERKEYRKRYNQLPETVEKRREKAKNPKEIEKRQKNNENEEVKKRKQECAAGRRKTLKDIKETHPDIYESIHAKNVKPLPPKPKRSKKATE